MAKKTETAAAADVATIEEAGELSILDRIIEDGKMARDENQRTHARDLIGEFVNQLVDEGMTTSKDTA